MFATPVIRPLVVAPTAIVVRIKAPAIRGLRIQVRRSSWAPRHVVTLRGKRGRVSLYGLRTGTTYVLRARACRIPASSWARPPVGQGRRAVTRRPICSRWSRPVSVVTLHAREIPRVVDVAPPPPMGPLPTIGFSDAADAWNHPDEFWGDLHHLGASEVRRILVWGWLEPNGPNPDFTAWPWRQLDAFMARAKAEQMPVVIETAWPAAWARAHDYGSNLGGAGRPDAFAAWTQLLADRYPGQIRSIGWNEPDCCSADSFVPYTELADMLQAAYPALHDRGVEVMAGGWCPCGSGGTTQVGGIKAMARLERERGRFFDSIALHLYPSLFGRAHGWEPPTAPTQLSFDTADAARIVSTVNAAFGREVPIHITETGWMTTGGLHGDAISGACQAAAVLTELSSLRRYPQITSVDWFLARDQASTDATHNVYKTGVRYDDGTAKPLYDALAAYVSSPPDDYSPSC